MTEAHSSPTPSNRHAVTVLAVSTFLNFTGFTLILPVVPFLVARYVEPDRVGLYVGLIVAVFALCAFVASPVLGALSDRYGRRPVLILSLLGSAAGYVIFGIGGALWVLFLGRIIDGLTAGNISTVFAVVADTQPPSERGRIYGLLGAIGGFGFMLGPVAGGLLGAVSPTTPLFVAAVLTVANATWVLIALKESAPHDRPRAPWRWSDVNPFGQMAAVLRFAALRVPFAAAFCFFFAGAMLQSNLSVYLKDIMAFGPTGIGWALFGVGVMDILGQGVLTRILLHRFDTHSLTRAGLFINALGFCLIACLVFVPHVGFLAASIFVFTLGDGLFQPSMSAIIANAAPADMQGRVQGANQAQQSLARMAGPLLAAAATVIGANTPYWIGALITLAGVVILSVWTPRGSAP